MKCSACGRRVNVHRTTCLYCGGDIEKEEKNEAIRCCSCNHLMVEENRYGVTIDVCPNCNSIWFDTGELEALLQAAPPISPIELRKATGPRPVVRFTPEVTPYRKCPHCQKSMAQQNYKKISGVIIDRCRIHGVFLDGMEFEKIQRFEESGGNQLANSRQQEIEQQRQRDQKSAERRKELGKIHERERYYVKTNWLYDLFFSLFD